MGAVVAALLIPLHAIIYPELRWVITVGNYLVDTGLPLQLLSVLDGGAGWHIFGLSARLPPSTQTPLMLFYIGVLAVTALGLACALLTNRVHDTARRGALARLAVILCFSPYFVVLLWSMIGLATFYYGAYLHHGIWWTVILIGCYPIAILVVLIDLLGPVALVTLIAPLPIVLAHPTTEACRLGRYYFGLKSTAPPGSGPTALAGSHRTWDDLRSDNRLELLSGPRTGLVLEGGGGKGAFAFGCLRALRKSGITVHCVAGTSVGALNAMAWAGDCLEGVDLVWKDLSFLRVAALRRSGIVILLLLPFFYMCSGITRRLSPLAVQRAFIVNAGWLPIFVVFSFLMRLTVMNWIYFQDPIHIALGYAFHWAGMEIVLVVSTMTSCALPFVWKDAGYAFLQSTPLADAIASHLGNCRLTIPTYITLARYVGMPDPTSAEYEIRWRPIADYWVASPEPELVRNHLVLASAALPLGVFPGVGIQTPNGVESFVDGGIVDNCPVYPLIAIERCTRIIVIRLRPFDGSRDDYLTFVKSDLQRIGVYRIHAARVLTGEHNLSDEDLRERFHEINEDSLPVPDLLVVAPPASLGGLISGTMNFGRTRATELLRQGEETMQRAIEEWKGAGLLPGELSSNPVEVRPS